MPNKPGLDGFCFHDRIKTRINTCSLLKLVSLSFVIISSSLVYIFNQTPIIFGLFLVQVAKISLQTSFLSEYTHLILLQTDSGKKMPEPILVQEVCTFQQ